MSAGSFVSVAELQRSIESIQDSVLRGKVAKAVSLLQRTFALYRCACSSGFPGVAMRQLLKAGTPMMVVCCGACIWKDQDAGLAAAAAVVHSNSGVAKLRPSRTTPVVSRQH
jgi:hypothetical protein